MTPLIKPKITDLGVVKLTAKQVLAAPQVQKLLAAVRRLRLREQTP